MGGCESCLTGPRAFLVPTSTARRNSQLLQHLHSKVELRRIYGLQAVGRLSAGEVISAGFVEVVANLLDESSWNVRHAAAAVLMATPGSLARCASHLERLLHDEDYCNRVLAASILHAMITSDSNSKHIVSHVMDVMFEISSDRSVSLKAVSSCGESLRYVNDELKSDSQVVSMALKGCGRALRHAPAELRRNRAMVLVAVSQDGLALQYASSDLQNDAEIVMKAVEQNEAAICYASEQFRDTAFMQEILIESNDLVDHWKATEVAVFRERAEAADFDFARRFESIEAMRSLAEALDCGDIWLHALALLDAFHSVAGISNSVYVALAAVMLAGKLNNAFVDFHTNRTTLALHCGAGLELTDHALEQLQAAERGIINALEGRLLLPSVGSWTDVIFRRMIMLAESDVVTKLHEAAPVAKQVAEIIAVRCPASAKTPPRMLAVSACAVSLVGTGLLSREELLRPGEAGVAPMPLEVLEPAPGEKLPNGGAVAAGRWDWPRLWSSTTSQLDAIGVSDAVEIDMATLRSEMQIALQIAPMRNYMH